MKPLKILVGCECSAVLRDAFRARGHDAYSCDIKPCERDPKYHIQADVLTVLDRGWDLMVGFPDCTYMANSGVQWLSKDPSRWEKLDRAAEFFLKLWNAPLIPKIALENPTMHRHAKQRIGLKETQAVNLYQFGEMESKRTCLWLKNLPKLTDTNNVYEEMMKLPISERQKVWWGGSRSKVDRSRLREGLAKCMAETWSPDLNGINR